MVLWFIDPLWAKESVDYINKMAAHLNPTISSSKHCLIVSKVDEVKDYYLDVDIVSALNIERVLHVSSKTSEGFDQFHLHLESLKPGNFYPIEQPGHLSKIVMLGQNNPEKPVY